jgi:glucose-6-phosphate dehydrogenase assembly protein OpcA
VHDLLVPNVRTVLLWGGTHVTDSRFPALAELAETIVLFSSAHGGGSEFLREIAQMHGTGVERKIRDLAFLRLLPWQDTIALFFDDPELVEELPHISRVGVTAGSAPEAYYLIGWLASRLSWEACGRHEFCNVDGGTISIDMRLEGPARRVSGVHLQSAHSLFSAVTEKDSEELLCLTVEGQRSRPQRCVPLHDVDMVSLIERAIFMPRNEIYEETLGMVNRLLEHES